MIEAIEVLILEIDEVINLRYVQDGMG